MRWTSPPLFAARTFSRRAAGSLSTTTSSGVPDGRCDPRTKTSTFGQGHRSAPSAGSNVVRPMSTASHASWNSTKPNVAGSNVGSASWAGQPSTVVTQPSRLMHIRVRILMRCSFGAGGDLRRQDASDEFAAFAPSCFNMTPSMSTSTDARERIQELSAQIIELRDAYYRGEPVVADADYDAIEDELRALVAAHPELAPDPNPMEMVGAPALLHEPVRHSRPMISLEKASTPEQLAAFFDRFPGQPVVVMPKLDGLSLALVYEGGRLRRAVTRGDGTVGEDVSVLVRALADGVPAAIEAEGRVEVRGELVMLRSTFAAYNAAHPDKPLINPRGAAAGTLRAKTPAAVEGRRMRFFAFDLDTTDGAHADLEEALESLGFEAPEMPHCDDAAAAQEVIAAIETQRNDLDYDLDGAVLRLADRNAYAAAGTRANSPRGALAFKFAAEEKTTLLADVLWDVGKTGKVAPVARLEPVFVGGTTVTRATLANQEVIRARGIRIGDTVLVRRAGDVIPFVSGVLDASKRTGAEREIEPPDTCPSCGSGLEEEGA